MSGDWKADFHQAIITYLVKNGMLVKEGKTSRGLYYGGWEEYRAYPGTGWEHECSETGGLMSCAPSENKCPYCGCPQTDPWVSPVTHLESFCLIDFTKSRYEDSDWSEFVGTFSDPPFEDRHGIDAIIYCECGEIQGRRWRFTGTHAELLRGITS